MEGFVPLPPPHLPLPSPHLIPSPQTRNPLKRHWFFCQLSVSVFLTLPCGLGQCLPISVPFKDHHKKIHSSHVHVCSLLKKMHLILQSTYIDITESIKDKNDNWPIEILVGMTNGAFGRDQSRSRWMEEVYEEMARPGPVSR